MGGGSSKAKAVAVTPKLISTPTTVHTTVHTTVNTNVLTTTADFKASEVKCWTDNHEILYISLALISGILCTIMVFAIIYLFRKKCKRSQQNSQEQVPSQTAAEEYVKNTQNEVAYSTVVFQRNRTPVAV